MIDAGLDSKMDKINQRLRVLPLLCLALQLAACGDGGSSSGSSPTPTPSPTASATESTKTPPLTGPGAPGGVTPVTISPLSTSTSFGGVLVSGNFYSLPTVLGGGLTSSAYVSYDAAAKVFTLKNVQTGRNRGTAPVPDTTMPIGSPDPAEARNVFHEEPVKLYVDGLDYVTHRGRSGRIYAYAAVAAHGYISNYTSVLGDVTREGAVIAFGFPSAVSRLPVSGSRTYVLDGFDLKSDKGIDIGADVHDIGGAGWTITLTVDFAAGTYVLSGRKSATTEDANWTYVDTGNIDASGSFTRSGETAGMLYGLIRIDTKRDATPKPGNAQAATQRSSTFQLGPFAAAFFGPDADEIGLAFTVDGTIVNGTVTSPIVPTRGAFLGRGT